jgi:5-methylthioadenosine/S-adenosylhomocysteine deaminase
LGLGDEIGSLEIGKRADLTVVKLKELHLTPRPRDIVSSLVYSAEAADVETVVIDGVLIMRDRELMTLNESEVMQNSEKEADQLVKRAGISR